jgi:fabA-like domain
MLVEKISYSFVKTYEANDFHFLGHFPNFPVFPGIYLLDEVLSSMKLMYSWRKYIIEQGRFFKKVTPNMELIFHVNVEIYADYLNLVSDITCKEDKIAKFKLTLYKVEDNYVT